MLRVRLPPSQHRGDLAEGWGGPAGVPAPRAQRNPDNTFNVSSSLTFQPTEQDQGVTFSCRVQHDALPHGALQTDFLLVFGGDGIGEGQRGKCPGRD